MTTTSINREVHNGVVYLTTEYRGTEYTLRRSPVGGRWEVTMNRLSLGRRHHGGYKSFDTLADVQANCKAFAGVYLTNAL